MNKRIKDVSVGAASAASFPGKLQLGMQGYWLETVVKSTGSQVRLKRTRFRLIPVTLQVETGGTSGGLHGRCLLFLAVLTRALPIMKPEISLLPKLWTTIPEAIRNRVGREPGMQRAILEEQHLLIILHQIPGPDDASRKPALFWRQPDGAEILA